MRRWMRKVLVVDDNLPSRELIIDILRPLGLEVAEAADGITALVAARILRPDLVILDLTMPGMDGFAVLNELRHDPDFAGTPVLAVTANAMPGERAKALVAGFSDFLTKPVRSAELRRRVEAFLNVTTV
jgi:CheY-like chemotaxis protein